MDADFHSSSSNLAVCVRTLVSEFAFNWKCFLYIREMQIITRISQVCLLSMTDFYQQVLVCFLRLRHHYLFRHLSNFWCGEPVGEGERSRPLPLLFSLSRSCFWHCLCLCLLFCLCSKLQLHQSAVVKILVAKCRLLSADLQQVFQFFRLFNLHLVQTLQYAVSRSVSDC